LLNTTHYTLHTHNMADVKTTNTLNKILESKKGYWTDEEPRGLMLNVTPTGETSARISLSSDYWYRVQHFTLPDSSTDDAWKVIKTVMKECGRSLVLHAPPTTEKTEKTENQEEQEDKSPDHSETKKEAPVAVHYSTPYLSAKQVDQIYYLLKHALTTAKIPFVISHSLLFDTSNGIAAPPKRRRRRKRNIAAHTANAWQIVSRK